jgi:hypothetical protein
LESASSQFSVLWGGTGLRKISELTYPVAVPAIWFFRDFCG